MSCYRFSWSQFSILLNTTSPEQLNPEMNLWQAFPKQWVWELDVVCLPWKYKKIKTFSKHSAESVGETSLAQLGNKTKLQTEKNPIPAYCRADSVEIFGRQSTQNLSTSIWHDFRILALPAVQPPEEHPIQSEIVMMHSQVSCHSLLSDQLFLVVY